MYRKCYTIITETYFVDKLDTLLTDSNFDTVGGKIQYYRRLRGIAQQELALATGFDRLSIIRYEKNLIQCGLTECNNIAAALQIDPVLIYDNYLSFISDDYVAKIKSLRRQLNLSQQGLAQLLKTTKKTVGRWEREQNVPSRKNIAAVLRLITTLQNIA